MSWSRILDPEAVKEWREMVSKTRYCDCGNRLKSDEEYRVGVCRECK